MNDPRSCECGGVWALRCWRLRVSGKEWALGTMNLIHCSEKSPFFGMIMMNFMLVPVDTFSIHISIGIKIPTLVLNYLQWGFLQDNTAVCPSSRCHMSVCDTSSLVRVTKDLKDFLKPFQTLAITNWPDLITDPCYKLIAMTAQAVSHQARVKFPWTWSLLHLASFIYRVMLPQEGSVRSPKDEKYLQPGVQIMGFKRAVFSCPIGTQEEMLSFVFEWEYELS